MPALSLAKDKIKILLLENIHPRAVDAFADQGYTRVELLTHALDGDALIEALDDVHMIGIRSRTQLTPEVLEAAPKLMVVGCFCIGTNQVALEDARALGIPVFNAPFSNTRSVAELVLAEIILLMRGIPARNAAAHRGDWQKSATDSHEIRGKTLGVVGYGHIGTQLGVLAEALGMRVLYYDIIDKLPLGNASPCASLEELVAQADVVSLHVPATEQTRNMFHADVLSRMKQGSSLINASRGNVVDIDALAKRLETGQIAGAAIDVFPTEPRDKSEVFESPLRAFDQVLLTPHIGGSTEEAQENIGLEVAHKLIRYSDNGTTQSATNFPQVSLPDQEGRSRLLHVHRNEPGVMQQLNRVFSEAGANIAAQYLDTSADTGYVVIDFTGADANELLDPLRAIEQTIRVRILY